MVRRMWFRPWLNRGFWGVFPMIGGSIVWEKHMTRPHTAAVSMDHIADWWFQPIQIQKLVIIVHHHLNVWT